MNYGGYAHMPAEKEKQEKISKRYKEIAHFSGEITMIKTPKYGKTIFTGTLDTEEAKKLSEMDVLIIADRGNLCFGGQCTFNKDGSFSGSYYVD